ncbi:hypothetical protein ACU637_26730, partial [Klebsiella aerogenes]
QRQDSAADDHKSAILNRCRVKNGLSCRGARSRSGSINGYTDCWLLFASRGDFHYYAEWRAVS